MSNAQALLRRGAGTSIFWISCALVVLVAFFAFAAPAGTFISTFNAQTLATDASTLLILATALTLVIVSGGLDLSVGSVMAFCAVIGLVTMRSVSGAGGSEWTAVAVGAGAALLCGAGWGAINGLLIAYARIPAFVVTLGTLGTALGAARLISGGSTETGAPAVLQADVGFSTIAGIPTPFVIGIAMAVLFGLVMGLTRFGERIYLVGSNEEGARRGGIATRWLHFRIYVMSGALSALAGLLDMARFNSASVQTGHMTELLAALAAVIIGGASLFGGSGLIIGSVVGVFIPVVLNNGFVIMGVQPFWHEIVVGAILVAAVGLDQVRRAAALRRSLPMLRPSTAPLEAPLASPVSEPSDPATQAVVKENA
jgi:ribose transport system permease protein